jgi:hypothetical protein
LKEEKVSKSGGEDEDEDEEGDTVEAVMAGQAMNNSSS